MQGIQCTKIPTILWQNFQGFTIHVPLDWIEFPIFPNQKKQFHWRILGTPVNPDHTFSSPGAAQKHRVDETCNFFPNPRESNQLLVAILMWFMCPQFGIATSNVKSGEKLWFNVVILLVVITFNLAILWFTLNVFLGGWNLVASSFSPRFPEMKLEGQR